MNTEMVTVVLKPSNGQQRTTNSRTQEDCKHLDARIQTGGTLSVSDNDLIQDNPGYKDSLGSQGSLEESYPPEQQVPILQDGRCYNLVIAESHLKVAGVNSQCLNPEEGVLISDKLKSCAGPIKFHSDSAFTIPTERTMTIADYENHKGSNDKQSGFTTDQFLRNKLQVNNGTVNDLLKSAQCRGVPNNAGIWMKNSEISSHQESYPGNGFESNTGQFGHQFESREHQQFFNQSNQSFGFSNYHNPNQHAYAPQMYPGSFSEFPQNVPLPSILNTHPAGFQFHASGNENKPKRRRVPTIAQRRAANIRERRRMCNLNEAFDELRAKVPTFAYEKRLSRIETLRLAMTYISFMSEVIRDSKNNEEIEKEVKEDDVTDGVKETLIIDEDIGEQ